MLGLWSFSSIYVPILAVLLTFLLLPGRSRAIEKCLQQDRCIIGHFSSAFDVLWFYPDYIIYLLKKKKENKSQHSKRTGLTFPFFPVLQASSSAPDGHPALCLLQKDGSSHVFFHLWVASTICSLVGPSVQPWRMPASHPLNILEALGGFHSSLQYPFCRPLSLPAHFLRIFTYTCIFSSPSTDVLQLGFCSLTLMIFLMIKNNFQDTNPGNLISLSHIPHLGEEINTVSNSVCTWVPPPKPP